jgi:hypothetical protein
MKPAASPCAPVRVSLGGSAAYHMAEGEGGLNPDFAPTDAPTLRGAL